MGKSVVEYSLWNRALSYVKDILIDERSSEYNKYIELYLVRGRLQLCCDDAIYSFDDLYDNFGESFKQLKLKEPAIHEVLILGLGLGSIPYLLEKNEKLNFNYTAVEIDEEIIDLASIYALPRLDSSIDIVCADAEAYVIQSERQFDLITMDIFEGLTIPSQFMELYFIEELKELLTEYGLLIMNCMAENPTTREKTQVFFDTVFKHVFPAARIITIKGNFMLISDESRIKN